MFLNLNNILHEMNSAKLLAVEKFQFKVEKLNLTHKKLSQ